MLSPYGNIACMQSSVLVKASQQAEWGCIFTARSNASWPYKRRHSAKPKQNLLVETNETSNNLKAQQSKSTDVYKFLNMSLGK